jgi:cell division protein ZapA (FtsZ GTPase activity inhibitor)
MQKQLKVTINGKQYSIATDEHDQDVFQAAQLVDSLIRSNTDKMPTVGADKIALMVALHLAIDLTKNQRLIEQDSLTVERLVQLVADVA